MTAITIVRGDTAIAIASDGAAYSDEGVLMQITTKVDLLPHAACVIAGRGSALAPAFFRNALFWSTVPSFGFDEILRGASSLSRQVGEKVREYGAPHTWDFTLFLCGWSSERQRMETYAIKSRDWEGIPGPDGDLVTAPAYSLVPLPAIHCAPAPEFSIAARFGITVPGVNMTDLPTDGADYAMRAVAATRFCPGNGDMDLAESDPFCCVGGFLQISIITKDTVTSQIVHRWPDVIGERMDPMRGEPHEIMPLWMLPPSVSEDAAPV